MSHVLSGFFLCQVQRASIRIARRKARKKDCMYLFANNAFCAIGGCAFFYLFVLLIQFFIIGCNNMLFCKAPRPPPPPH